MRSGKTRERLSQIPTHDSGRPDVQLSVAALQKVSSQLQQAALNESGAGFGPGFEDDAVMEIELILPIPPTVNHHYGINGKRRYIARQGRLFRHEVAVIAQKEGVRGAFGKTRLAVAIVLHLPAGGDIDNRVKPLLDALEHADVFSNDSQVDSLFVVRGSKVKGGRCYVRIWTPQ